MAAAEAGDSAGAMAAIAPMAEVPKTILLTLIKTESRSANRMRAARRIPLHLYLALGDLDARRVLNVIE